MKANEFTELEKNNETDSQDIGFITYSHTLNIWVYLLIYVFLLYV